MRPFLKAKVTKAELDEHGVMITVALDNGEAQAEFRMLVGPDYNAPTVGETFRWEIPLRKRRQG